MKTTLFLTALFISTITFAQTSKKGYDYYQNASANKASASAISTGDRSSIKTSGRMGNHPNITQHNWVESPSRSRRSKQSRATDYNSSRSNKSEKSGTRATDYNSSRSNKSEKSGTRATDYNSSRSNKSEKSGTRATDYNSSRSNRRGINADATDYNISRSNRRGIRDTNPDNTRSNKKAFAKKPGNNDNPMYKENTNKGTNPLYNQ